MYGYNINYMYCNSIVSLTVMVEQNTLKVNRLLKAMQSLEVQPNYGNALEDVSDRQKRRKVLIVSSAGKQSLSL